MTEDDWEKIRTVRIGQEWEDFGDLCDAAGTNRAAEIRRYIRWALQRPDAPKRLTRPRPKPATE